MKLMQMNRDSGEHVGIQRCDRRAGLRGQDRTAYVRKKPMVYVFKYKFSIIEMDRPRVASG